MAGALCHHSEHHRRQLGRFARARASWRQATQRPLRCPARRAMLSGRRARWRSMGPALGCGTRRPARDRRHPRRRHPGAQDRGARMTYRNASRTRDGFVLFAVLWVVVGLASLGLALSLVGRDAVGATQDRVNLTRAHWLAEGCVNVVRAVAAGTLADREHANAAGRTPA